MISQLILKKPMVIRGGVCDGSISRFVHNLTLLVRGGSRSSWLGGGGGGGGGKGMAHISTLKTSAS